MKSNGFANAYAQLLDLGREYFAAMQSIWEHQVILWDNLQEYSLVASKIQGWRAQYQYQYPLQYWQAYANYMEALGQLVVHLQEKRNNNTIPPLIALAAHDKRFHSKRWHEDLYFYSFQQHYLLWVQHVENAMKEAVFDRKSDAQVKFYVKQWLDAIAPNNYWFSNPEAFDKTLTQKGQNLIEGWRYFCADLVKGQGYFNPTMVDQAAYHVGKDIAITRGKVVYKNRLMELLQYSPTTSEVHATPLLIIPPWINKFYILDLRQENSFVKWIVDQGFTVFMISWKNPDPKDANTAFSDYMFQGILPATEKILSICNTKQLNALGFCIGGTLLSMTLAYLAGKNDNRFNSATFLATLIDFADAGDLSLFIDEPQFALLQTRMARQGYLDGRLLMGIFNQLRANDLIWPYIINNYLLGQKPHAFDLLYWNQDSTHLPAKMMSEYLENLYLNNRLVKGKLTWDHIPLQLQNIHLPCYFIATEQDHIAPWHACFAGAKQFNTDLIFVLGGSGHIAGIVNPPQAQKYGYYTAVLPLSSFPSATAWLHAATKQTGSWWEHWQNWLAEKSGEQVQSRELAEKLPDAPGEYVNKSIYTLHR